MLDRRDFITAAALSASSTALAQAPGPPPAPAAAPSLPPVPTAAPVPAGPLVTPAFASFARETRFADLPPEAVEATKWFLLDTLGCGLAGHRLERAKGPVALAAAQGGRGARVLGTAITATPGAAAFANGELINSLDYDCLPHTAPYVAASVLAAAEATRASGPDLIAATAIGLEIAGRISRNTSTMGSAVTQTGLTPEVFGIANEAIIGAAAGIARLMKLDATGIAHAMGLAAFYCAVPYSHDWELRSPKSMVKYGPVGPSCQNAYNAAFLASQGYTGDPLVLDGPAGFVLFYERHQWDAKRVLDGLGAVWAVSRSDYKPYAACKFVHSQIEAMEALVKRTGLRADEVAAVHSHCFPFVGNLEMMNVRTQEDGQFSIPYVLALALHGVPLDAHAYDRGRMDDPAIRATMRKIAWSWHPDALTLRATTPGSYPCRIDVQARGQTFSEGVIVPASLSPGPAMSAKFLANAAVTLPKAKAQAAHDAIMALDRAADVEATMDLLTLA